MLVLAELLGVLALPLAAALLPRLPAGAEAFAKPLGLLLLGWVVWLLAGAGLPYDTPLVLGALGLAGVVALLAWRGLRRGGLPPALTRSPRRVWIAGELVFLTAFAVAAGVVAFAPDVWGTEKPMDMALINAVNSSRALPPQNPWLAGELLDGYYYFGHLLAALSLRVTAVEPTHGYNAFLALTFALSASAAYGLGAAVAASAGRPPVRAGLIAVVLALGIGNLAGAAAAVETDGGPRAYPWFEVSRVVPDTINEFPLFAWLLGDLHAHLIAVAFSFCALAFALQWLTSRPRLYDVTAAGVLCGLLYAINAWSYPVICGLLVVALLASGGWTARTAVRVGLLLGVGVLAVAPFLLDFSPAAAGVGIVAERRPFGLFLRDQGLMLGLFAWLLIPLLVGAFSTMRHPWRNLVWAMVALAAAGTVAAARDLTGVVLLGAGLAFALWQLVRRGIPGAERFAWLLVAGGLGCVLLPEVVFVRDPFAGGRFERMNTVFKFGFQAWLLLSIAVATALAVTWPRTSRGLRLALIPGAVLLGVASLAFTVLGPYARTGSFERQPTLDGLGWLRARAPGDVAAIAWLRTHAAPDAIVLESVGDDYSGFGHARISTFTGRATVLGWSGHVLQWGDDPGDRRAQVTALYRSTEVASARAVLRRYGVDYVVVGPIERADFGVAGAAKWDAIGSRVFDTQGTTVWRVSS